MIDFDLEGWGGLYDDPSDFFSKAEIKIRSNKNETELFSDSKESKNLLVKIMMEKYNISENDLDNINIVKAKIRESKINEIL
jgi:hypothetical protein